MPRKKPVRAGGTNTGGRRGASEDRHRPAGGPAAARPGHRGSLPEAPEASQGWRPWAPLGAGIGAGVLALALYLATLAPTVTFADAGELASAAYFLDVGHPPGFPLYLLLGKLFTLLVPWGRVVQRLNAFSAVCAAAAVGLFAAAMVQALPLGQRKSEREGTRAWSWPVLALAAAGLLGTSRTFWEQATLTEVYALNMALSAGLLFALVRYLRARQEGNLARANRALAAAALLTGLGLANHLTLVFIAGGVFLAAWVEEGARFWQGRRLLVWSGLLALGLSIYLYLPIRAHALPPMNWGDPSTWVRFWRHVSAAQYSSVSLTPNPTTWFHQLQFYVPRFWGEFTPLPLLLVPLGLGQLFRQQRALAWGTVTSGAMILFYALSYEIAEDQETYVMLFFLLMATWMAYGMVYLAGLIRARAPNSRFALPAVAGGLLLLMLWPLLAHWPLCDRRGYTYAESYARDVLNNVPEGSLILTRDWNFYAPTYYLQHVEGVRPDVVIVDQELLRRSWYLGMLARQQPWLVQQVSSPLEAYREELLKFEREGIRRYQGAAIIQPRYQKLGTTILEAAMAQSRAAFMTGEVEYLLGQTVVSRFVERLNGGAAREKGGVGEAYKWAPEALAFRVEPTTTAGLPEETLAQPALSDGRQHDDLTRKMVDKYIAFWLYKGDYLRSTGKCPEAISAYQHVLAIDTQVQEAQVGIQACGGRE